LTLFSGRGDRSVGTDSPLAHGEFRTNPKLRQQDRHMRAVVFQRAMQWKPAKQPVKYARMRRTLAVFGIPGGQMTDNTALSCGEATKIRLARRLLRAYPPPNRGILRPKSAIAPRLA
jgi:ATPase subunit of ABC transporter with duplicated ATPase domains